MRVAVVTSFGATDTGGSPDRVNGIVEALAELGHEPQRVTLPIRKPLLAPRHRPYWYLRPDREWLADARRRLAGADLVVASLLPAAAALVPLLAPRRLVDAPVVYDAHNDEARLARITRSVHARAIAGLEARVVQSADVTWAAGSLDAASLGTRHPDAIVLDVPNGVPPLPDLLAAPRRPRTAFTYGSWTYGPNFAGLAALAGAASTAPGDLHVFGALDGLRRRWILTRRHRGPAARPHWHLRGFVPDLATMAAEGAGPGIIPVWTGGGTKLRAVQLAALGVPVVATREAVSGLPSWFATHVTLREEPGALLDAAFSPDDDDRERARVLRALVGERLSWRAVVADALARTIAPAR
jgi:hypothetical protein